MKLHVRIEMCEMYRVYRTLYFLGDKRHGRHPDECDGVVVHRSDTGRQHYSRLLPTDIYHVAVECCQWHGHSAY